MEILDAKGLSCPEPVIMLRKAMATNDAAYEIEVDNRVSKENVSRYAKHQGYSVDVSEDKGIFRISMKKS